MKKLRIIVALMLVLSMVLAFSACGQKAPEESAATESPAATQESVASEAPASEAPASEAPTEAAVLTMGTNAQFPPYEYKEGENIVGIDAEIAALIADKLGMTLKIEDMEFDSVIPSVQSGKVNMAMAGLTVTDERKQAVDFTASYATGKQVIIVKNDSSIADAAGLEGKTIGVQLSTTGDLYITWDLVDTNKAKIERYNKGADAVQALVNGKIDAVVIDNEPAKVFVSQNEGLKILETEYITEQYAIAVGKNNTELRDKIDAALQELIASGDVQKIIDKYIKAD
jgi:ABC-type amino acid transport substrate-binding protein